MRDKIASELERSLAVLRQDIERVEIWVGALKGYAEPIPDYESPYRRLKIPARDVNF